MTLLTIEKLIEDFVMRETEKLIAVERRNKSNKTTEVIDSWSLDDDSERDIA